MHDLLDLNGWLRQAASVCISAAAAFLFTSDGSFLASAICHRNRIDVSVTCKLQDLEEKDFASAAVIQERSSATPVSAPKMHAAPSAPATLQLRRLQMLNALKSRQVIAPGRPGFARCCCHGPTRGPSSAPFKASMRDEARRCFKAISFSLWRGRHNTTSPC